MKRGRLQALIVAAALSVSAQAYAADPFTFDYNGTGATGPALTFGAFDWNYGSALAIGSDFSNGIQQGDSFTTYYQANLFGLTDLSNNPLYSTAGGNPKFTAVAGFGETVTNCPAPCTNATFAFDAANPVNFFHIYQVPAFGDMLNGTGFVNGAPILSGHVVSTGFGSNFNVTASGLDDPTTPLVDESQLLDQSANGDQWGGVLTVVGNGSSQIRIVIDFVNALYFPDITAGYVFTFGAFNTSQIDPFAQTDPSKRMVGVNAGTVTEGFINSEAAVGTHNGLFLNGANGVLFQADANLSLERVLQVSEPASLALVGLGMLGLAGFGRRRSSR